MELSDLSRLTDEQEAGHAFELRDPVHGQPTGIKFTIAGPDSKIAKKALADMARSVTQLGRRNIDPSPAERIRINDDYLFAVTLGWDVKEKGKAVPFNRDNFQRVVEAGIWIRAQIDGFAVDRSPYFKAAD